MNNNSSDQQVFTKLLRTEMQCCEHIANLRSQHEFSCTHCRYDDLLSQHEPKTKYPPKDCRLQSKIISGTIFEKAHLPLTSWFQAIWAMCQLNQRLSEQYLKNEFNITRRTASVWSYKLKSLTYYCDPPTFKGTVEIGYFFLRDCYIGIALEVNNYNKGQANRIYMDSFCTKDLSRNIDAHLTLFTKKIENISNVKIIQVGDVVKSLNSSSFKIFSDLKKFLPHHCPQKNIGYYLYEYCFKLNHLEHTAKSIFNELLQRAINSSPTPYGTDSLRPKIPPWKMSLDDIRNDYMENPPFGYDREDILTMSDADLHSLYYG